MAGVHRGGHLMVTRVDSSTFRKMLREMPKDVIIAAEKVNRKTANDMGNHIRRIAPRKSGLLVSTVDVIAENDGAHTVVFGGPKTTKTIGNRTYATNVQVGAGKKTTGIKSGGTGRVTFDYARLIEWGSKRVKKDPSFVPARRRASRLYRSRMRTAIRKVAQAYSA